MPLETINRDEDGPKYERSHGSIICLLCGRFYSEHPLDKRYLGWPDNTPYLTLLCSGELVKL